MGSLFLLAHPVRAPLPSPAVRQPSHAEHASRSSVSGLSQLARSGAARARPSTDRAAPRLRCGLAEERPSFCLGSAAAIGHKTEYL